MSFGNFHLLSVIFAVALSYSSQIVNASLISTLHSTAIISARSLDSKEERCFIAIKHDAVQRSLVGEVISRFEKKGLKLTAMKLIKPTQSLGRLHYESLSNASFFDDLVNFFTSGPIVIMIFEGLDSILLSRKLIGRTHPEDAEPGTIRGDYCHRKGRNLVHASDSSEAAEREMNIWFTEDDLVEYSK